ncbi:hypothetical protein CFR71_08885 [Novacetimonas pomaceti]|uniref:Uncharacterized protein n=1 Tax=Novacetimonas pomaceti TaxID=2021998 RepID=A0A318Q774_9PROT|nr:hypothetical protein CFR71_08885 [Novacetimonas pomaceti]
MCKELCKIVLYLARQLRIGNQRIHLRGIDHDDLVPREGGGHMPRPQQRLQAPRLVPVTDKVIQVAVNQAVTVKECIETRGDAYAPFGIRAAQPLFQQVRIGCMHFQPHDGNRAFPAPVLGRLPAEIPYPHALAAVAPDAEFIFRALRAISINLPVIGKDADRGPEMFRAAGASRADAHRAKGGQGAKVPSPNGNPQSLHPFGTVHHQDDLRAVGPEMGIVQKLLRQRQAVAGQGWAGPYDLRSHLGLHGRLESAYFA